MTFRFSERSRVQLATVHPLLRQVVELALKKSKVDFKVIEGVRSDHQSLVNFGKGRTVAELAPWTESPATYARPREAKVTWLRNPFKTRHRKQADGWAHAVDLLPAPYDWKETAPFDEVARAMFEAARELGVEIRWGADWDRDGRPRERGEFDSPHFELVL